MMMVGGGERKQGLWGAGKEGGKKEGKEKGNWGVVFFFLLQVRSIPILYRLFSYLKKAASIIEIAETDTCNAAALSSKHADK